MTREPLSVMPRLFGVCLIASLLSIVGSSAVAQNAGDIMNMFSNIMRAAIIDHARTEWLKLPPDESSCVEERLEQQGASIDTLVQNGIVPTDPRVSNIRSGCRVSATSMPSPAASPGNVKEIQNLSAKPTFDCTKARSATARILCLDQAGAAADWDLASASWARYFSLSEDARDAFNQAQQNWLDSLNRTCRLSSQQSTFSPFQRNCVLNAFNSHSTGYRSQLKEVALLESRLTPEQHAELQSKLISLGFLNDTLDGEF